MRSRRGVVEHMWLERRPVRHIVPWKFRIASSYVDVAQSGSNQAVQNFWTSPLPAAPMDITTLFNDDLAARNCSPTKPYTFDAESLDSFLSEAYRINGHITELTRYLRTIRAPYLALGSHRPAPSYRPKTNGSLDPSGKDEQITDVDRKRIEEDTKDLISGISIRIYELSENAKTESQLSAYIARKTRAKRGLGALGRWAAGGAAVPKTEEEQTEEAREEGIKLHREAVIYFLQKRLESVSKIQRNMVAVRLERTMERNKSVLYQAGIEAGPLGFGSSGIEGQPGFSGSSYGSVNAIELEEESRERQDRALDSLLSPEQMQMFEREQNDMVKHYNSELQKIRYVSLNILPRNNLLTLY
jgi:syntaxin 18